MEGTTSRHNENIHLTMLKKRGIYILQYLDKIEVTTIKALKNNLSKDPIKEIKSIFGIYEIILLEVVNDLKYSEIEDFGAGIQKLFKQILSCSLHLVKGVIKTFQKMSLAQSKDTSEPIDGKGNIEDEAMKRKMFEFKEKFFFSLQEEAKVDINARQEKDEEYDQLMDQVKAAKENILMKKNESSVNSCLKEAIQYFSRSTYGSKMILQNAENEIKMSDFQLKETEEAHSFIERAMYDKQKKMRIFKKTLMSDMIMKKPTQTRETQTEEVFVTQRQERTQVFPLPNRDSKKPKDTTQGSEELQDELAKRFIEKHQLAKELLQANKRVEMLGDKVLELKDLLVDKNEVIRKLQGEAQGEEEATTEKVLIDQILENPLKQVADLKPVKDRRHIFFKKSAQIVMEVESSERGSTTNEDLSPCLMEPSLNEQFHEESILKDSIQDNFSIIWSNVYEKVYLKPITKQEFVMSFVQEIHKNGVIMTKISEKNQKVMSNQSIRKRDGVIPSKKEILFKKIPFQEHPKTASEVKRKHHRSRKSLQSIKISKPQSEMAIERLERLTQKPVLRTKVRRETVFQSPSKSEFKQNFPCSGEIRVRQPITPGTETFTSLIPFEQEAIDMTPFLRQNLNTTPKYESRPPQVQISQDKFIVKLYHRYTEWKLADERLCQQILVQLGLQQVSSKVFLPFEQFALAASKHITKHRNCPSALNSPVCNHLWSLLLPK